MNSPQEQILKERNAKLEKALSEKTVELQKKNRELEIEAALEKVRSRAMSMQKSTELAETASLLFKQVSELGIKTFSCGFQIWETNGLYTTAYMSPDGVIRLPFRIPFTEQPYFKKIYDVRQSGEDFLVIETGGKELQDIRQFLFNVPGFISGIEDFESFSLKMPAFQITHSAFFSQGFLSFITPEPVPEAHDIFKRFAKVFEQTYTRFLDLQKAEAQSGESQIQLALERVRARTMAMQHSEELSETASEMFKQIQALGMHPWACGFNIFDKDEKAVTQWMSIADGGISPPFRTPLTEDPFFISIYEARQRRENLLVMESSGKELEETYRYMFSLPDSGKIFGDIEESGFEMPKFQITHCAYFSQGYLVFITYEPVPEAHDMFKRFAKVFEQTYTRFLDLQKAEAQARESQIQLALERVRAKTMAMQKPSEFVDVINIIGEQFVHLGFDIDWVNFGANGLEISKGIDIWNFAVIPGASPISARVFIPYFDHPVFTTSAATINEFINGGKDFITVTLDKQTKDTWLDHMFTKTIFKDVPEEYRVIQYAKPGYSTSNISLKDTWLSIGKFDIKNFTDEQHAILRRFANAFGQAYTRFLDLKKAEAQAREAQIELSLEHVRAKTMAMHNSQDVGETVAVMFDELRKLDVETLRCGVGIMLENYQMELWTARPDATGKAEFIVGDIDMKLHPLLTGGYEAWKNRDEDFFYQLKDEDLKTYFDAINSHGAYPAKYDTSSLPSLMFHYEFNFNEGCLFAFSIKQFSDESSQIFKRFTGVFGQTYTRFLDLQKAEAQAREAQIELGLERVRAKAMAMQGSNELKQLIGTVYTELTKLDIALVRCLIWVMDSEDFSSRLWMYNPESQPVSFYMPYHESPPYLAFVKAWKERNISWQYDLHGSVKKDWDEFVFNNTEMKHLPDAVKKGMQATERTILAASFHNFGCLQTVGAEPLRQEQFDILNRFARVFDLTYTRFADLKKAEAQAREAQIELSLERVRAKTMAMHNSQDVGDTVATMFDELVKLGVETNRCGILIFSNTNNAEVWTAKSSAEGAVTLIIGLLDVSIHPMLQGMRNAWKTKEPFFSYEMIGDDIKNYYNAINNYAGYPTQFDIGSLPSKEIHSDFFFSEGAIFAFTSDPIPAEASQIFKRFSGVFGQTYRRYLDLKKAEAQARDAQIEASLERVRASAMAMHRSDELSNVLAILFEQFDVLKIQPVDVHLDLFDLEKNTFSYRATGKEGKRVIAEQIVDLGSRPEWQALLQKWKNGKPNTVDFSYYPKEVIKELMAFFPDIWTAMPEDAIMSPEDFPDGIFDALGFCKFGYIGFHHYRKATEEEQKILIRFANEFERLYQRFLDLQKAEARVREAQIESSLERVRSKTMAMHNSQDVGETVAVMFDELRKLDVETLRCGVGIMLENYQMELWTARPDATGKAEFIVGHIDMKLHPLLTGGYEAWKNRDEDFFYQLKDEDLKTYFDAINSHGAYPAKYDTSSLPSLMFHYEFNFNEGCLFAFSIKQFSDESSQIFKRFSGVFGQTYRRYLDLKKAEAQAREAQIELSLERVRAKTMAMHNSQDVGDTVATMFAEFVDLGIRTNRCGILIFDDNDSAEVWTARTVAEGKATLIIGKVDLNIYDLLSSAYKSWKDKKPIYQYELHGDDIVRHYEAINRSEYYPIKFDMNALPQKEFHSDFFFPEGAVFAFTAEPIAEEHAKIMKRFAGVFGQTYRRYLDLQKAEAQAREAQIEVALERVRARAMAMQKSDELKELIGAVFIELTKLDLVLTRCLIMIYDTTTNGSTWWMANSEAPSDPIGLFVKYHEHPPYLAYINAWKERNLKWQYILEGAVKKEWDDFLFVETELSLLPDFVIEGMKAPDRVYLNSSFNSFGNLTLASLEPLSNEHFDILLRFAKVFDLTYTRFNDLKQAEAQAREAKIEAALERVRAQTMAMHNSEDVTSATETMFEELKKLGIDNLRCGIANVHLNKTFDVFGVTNLAGGNKMSGFGLFGHDEHPIWQRWFESWKNKEEVFIAYITGQEKEEYFNIINSHRNYLPQQIVNFPDNFFQAYYFEQGSVWAYSLIQHSDPEKDIMKRFATGFSLTFRRYQDLKKAEAQAREAQIEAALERVRARTMAMFKSDELAETAVVVFKQMNGLGIIPNRLYIVIINDDSGNMEFWITDENGDKIGSRHMVSINENISLKTMYDGWSYKKKTIIIDQQGNELQDWLSYWKENFGVSFKDDTTIKRRVQTIAYFSKGFIAIASPDDEPRSTMNLLERFAAVFNLTYTRFNDLQIAEIQAREAQIEAALERVRGKAMAMQNSNDLSVAASMVFAELRKLGINPIRCGVGLLNKEFHKAQLYSATSSADGDHLSLVGWVQLEKHPVLEKIYDSWLQQYDYFPELQGEGLRSYYQLLLAGLSVAVPDTSDNQKQYGHFLPFSVGCLYAWSGTPYNETEIKILKRFAAIIDLTFRRYIELQKSEANAREAVKQAALDRVRAEIASMRTITDLDKITPLIWNELNILGIPFIRCGVFLMDDLQKLIHTFLSTPDGKAIAAFHLPYDTPGNFAEMIKRWHNKQIYIDHWGETEFISMAETLVKQGAITTKEQYLNTLPGDGFYLHFLPFLQGMLYVGNTTQLGEEEVKLIQSVADAFSTAYARYEDFNKLESAKVQIEKTLVDLKQTQAQLVQSEKMASLGELTAGIAHEIQNPLNFVNNFSEVSTELLDEMITELKSDNKEDAIAIADDVKQNLEKILHHGKRADGIVKGMLQHSRSSSATKEATDINKLADEYFRLAYHGLRAKDKSFNATMITDYDETIGNINIIPQDIGRVILNLIMNAFYTVAEKKKQIHDHYEPTVSLTTKKINDKIEVKIRDNGNGIPGKVIDKIFQPFFTTKPTGQGTGLGLSLAYDIIKTHNGELKVDTKEGEGSEFIIQLPV